MRIGRVLLCIFLVCMLAIVISSEKSVIIVHNRQYASKSIYDKYEDNYVNLKNIIEEDEARNTGDFFDKNIEDAKCALGLGFNFGLQLDWTTNQNSKTRRYKIRISVGNGDTEYYYYDSYVSELANLYNYGYPNGNGNRANSSQPYATLGLTVNSGATIDDDSSINNMKIYLSNTFAEAIDKDVIVNLKYLKLIDKNGNDIINDSSVLKEYIVNVQSNNTVVLSIPLDTTVGDFYGEDSKILADVQLDNYISDYKDNVALLYSDSMNGYGPTDEELQFLKDQGFKSIRLPITWYNHMDSTGTIDSEWFSEINSTVNRIIDYGFYVIVNIHQEGGKYGWIKADETDFLRNEYLYRYMVLQIAQNFKNYGDKLILAGPNEVTNYDKIVAISSNTPQSDIDTYNRINQIFVDEVRRTGYNNTNRFLVTSPWYAFRNNLSYYVLPNDTAVNKLFTEIHDYTIRDNGTLASLEYFQGDGAQYLEQYNIILGEFGIFRTEPLDDRLRLMNTSVPLAYQLGIPMFIWDEGGNYAIMKKKKAEWDTSYDSDKVALAMITSYNEHFDGICKSTHNVGENDAATKKITVTTMWMNDDQANRPDNVKVYLNKKMATLLPGENLNVIMKNLAGMNSPTVGSYDNRITAIVRASSLDDTIDSQIVSTDDSDYDVYMWYKGGTIFFYSDADNIYMNSSAASTFRGLRNLVDISDLKYLNTTYVIDMNRMFLDTIKLTDLSSLASWDVSNVVNMQFMLGANNNSNTYNCDTPMQYSSLLPIANWNTQKVENMNQMFKCATSLETLDALSKWNVSNLVDASQMFLRSGVVNASGIANWDVVRVTKFNQMLANTGLSVSQMPVFIARGGSWDSSGNYSPIESALTDHASTITKVLDENMLISEDANWVKNGNVWSYEFEVSNDGSIYSAWEDSVINYTSDTLYYNKRLISNDQIIITNTFNKFDIVLSKSVIDGTMINDEEYVLLIKIFNYDNNVFVGNVDIFDGTKVTTIASTDNGFNINMKDFEQIKLKNIPSGYNYTIVMPDTGCKKYYSIEKTDETNPSLKPIVMITAGNVVHGLLNENQTVKFIYGEPEFTKGDMNKNGIIDLSDVIILLKKYLIGDDIGDDIRLGDMDDSGYIELRDIIMLLRLYLS